MMKLILTFFIFLLALMIGPGYAQEDKVATAASALQQVLSTLQQSVQKLNAQNDQLNARDVSIKDQIVKMQTQLAQLEAQAEVLNKASDRLHEKNPRRAEQITKLESENFDLDDRAQKAQAAMKITQQSLDAGYREDQRLLLQLKHVQNFIAPAPAPPSPESIAAIKLQKEKLTLMKMIYESQRRQAALHQSIIDFQKNAPVVPAASALAHQQVLKDQIKDLELEIASYAPAESPSINMTAGKWDSVQLHQLELDLKVLEKNYIQLKDLFAKMNLKAKSIKMSVSDHVEEVKLQTSLESMNHQGVALRADLDDLRSQMIDLDKRKSRLTTMIQQLP